MKTYVLDTNIFLRFNLQDNVKQFNTAKEYFLQAQKQVIRLVCYTETLLELEYVLRKVYKYQKFIIAQYISAILDMDYITVIERKVLKNAIPIYRNKNIDLVDLVIHFKALEINAEVLSFDKDFKKLV